jgi:LPXTG-motif cell wall-anchored protein
LASPVVAVADESEVTEEALIDENSDPPVVTNEPWDVVLFVEGDPPTASTVPPDDAESEDPAEAEAMTAATDSEPVGTDSNPMVAPLQTSGAGGPGGTGDEHAGEPGGTGDEHAGEPGGTDDEHPGGPGEEHTGDPYRITFEVSWRLLNDSTIPVLDDVLPADWRSMFDLAAASATGGGKPTSAYCTYPPESTDLVCEFENPGHKSVTDGMIVPGKKSATYSVTVPWPTSGWTIDGANAGPYSARDLDSCPPRGGGGHDSGHDETVEVAAPEETGSVCIHTVVIRQSPVPPEPPPVEPPAKDPPVSEVPAAAPPQSQTPAPPEATPTLPVVEVLPVTVTPKALPATGNTASTTLMIGTIILALGGCLSVLARRRTDLPVS